MSECVRACTIRASFGTCAGSHPTSATHCHGWSLSWWRWCVWRGKDELVGGRYEVAFEVIVITGVVERNAGC